LSQYAEIAVLGENGHDFCIFVARAQQEIRFKLGCGLISNSKKLISDNFSYEDGKKSLETEGIIFKMSGPGNVD
jgi:hypothetical protein